MAIEKALGILGHSSLEAIYEDLEHKGISLNDASSSYSLKQIEVVFIKDFGEDATILLMERIKAEIARLNI